MALAAPEVEAGFLRVLDVTADSVEDARGAFERLERAELHAVRLRAMLSPASVARAIDRLEADGFGSSPSATTSEGEPVQVFGSLLQWAEPDLVTYFDAAAHFRGACREVFAETDYEAQMATLLGVLTAPHSVEPMRGEAGLPYTFATIRRLIPGGAISPHVEEHQLVFPGSREVAAAITGRPIMSVLMLLAAPTRGGELVLHDLDLATFEREPALAERRDVLRGELDRRPRAVVAIEPGDLLIFNSGRFFHEVTPVEGPRPRWSIGGFCAARREGGGVVYWA